MKSRFLQSTKARCAYQASPLKLELLEDRTVPAITVRNMVSPESLVTNMVGGGMQVSNIQFTGIFNLPQINASAGLFTGGTDTVGFESGVIFTNGAIQNVPVPPLSALGTNNGLPGDAQLDALITPTTTTDASTLEFDFIPTTSILSMNIVFGSSEYNSVFPNSDAAGIFVNGVNVLVVPGTTTPINANTVNQFLNSVYFKQNFSVPPPFNSDYTGFTTILQIQAFVTPGQINHVKFAIADTGNDFNDSGLFIQANSVIAGPPQHYLVTGADLGGPPHVKVFDSTTHQVKYSFLAYSPTFHGGVRVASGDVNADGVPDIVTGAGIGGSSHIRVFDGSTGTQIAGPLGSFLAFNFPSPGGVFVAAGDVNNDGFADVIVGTGEGQVTTVRVFSGQTGLIIHTFNPYGSLFQGGARVASADIDGDFLADIITGAGPGGGPHVKVFTAAGTQLPGAVGSFFAYGAEFLGGVFVAGGEFGGPIDRRIIGIVTSPGPSAPNHIKIFDTLGNERFSFIPGPSGLIYFDDGNARISGTRVAVVDWNNDGFADIVQAFGPKFAPIVNVYDVLNNRSIIDTFFAYDKRFLGGVYIGGS